MLPATLHKVKRKFLMTEISILYAEPFLRRDRQAVGLRGFGNLLSICYFLSHTFAVLSLPRLVVIS
jgi:hypothetical protein